MGLRYDREELIKGDRFAVRPNLIHMTDSSEYKTKQDLKDQEMNTKPSSRIVFTGKEKVELEAYEASCPGDDEVRIKAKFSLISSGTESIVFARQFDQGTHWDKWIKYPFYTGYAMMGEVDEVGENVTRFKKGDRIVARAPHQAWPVVSEYRCYALPDSVQGEAGPWFALGKIALHGALQADYRLGRSVVILGAGPIGQMSLRWAVASGASSIIVVDRLEEREKYAMAGGATAYYGKDIVEGTSAIIDLLGGNPPDIVVDTTGNAAVFSSALELVKSMGRVVLLGDTGFPGKQMLSSNMIKKGITLAAAHDTNAVAGWNPHSMVDYFFKLVESGRFDLGNLTTHRFRPSACAEAYDLVTGDRGKTMGVLFDWA